MEYNVTYLSLRVLLRVHGDAGAVAGIFTYLSDTAESDIEILTRDPSSHVHYSNQPVEDAEGNVNSQATMNVSMPANRRWTDWAVHRLDWTPGRSVFFVDGRETGRIEVNVPTQPSMVILNMWSNAGSWSGRMKSGGQAWLDVQYVEMAFNTSSSQTSYSNMNADNRDMVVCTLDKVVGEPRKSAASSRAVASGRTWTLLISVVAIFAIPNHLL